MNSSPTLHGRSGPLTTQCLRRHQVLQYLAGICSLTYRTSQTGMKLTSADKSKWTKKITGNFIYVGFLQTYRLCLGNLLLLLFCHYGLLMFLIVPFFYRVRIAMASRSGRNTWTIGNPCFCLCLMIPNISLSIRQRKI